MVGKITMIHPDLSGGFVSRPGGPELRFTSDEYKTETGNPAQLLAAHRGHPVRYNANMGTANTALHVVRTA